MKALIVNRGPLGRLVRIMAWFQRAFTDREVILLVITCLCIALFSYSGAIKLAEYGNFVVRIGQSPMLAPFAGFIGWFIPVFELVISVALIVSIFVSRIQLPALYLFFGTMVLFCFYIIAIFTISPDVPCACGGVIGEIGGWWGHLLFNLVFVWIAYQGIRIVLSLRPFSSILPKRCFQVSTALPFIVVAVLGMMVDPLPNHRFRGFERQFASPMALHPINAIDVKYSGYYIAGSYGTTIYLAHRKLVDHVLSVDIRTMDTLHHQITIPSITYRSLTLRVEGLVYYLMDGASQNTYRGLTSNWETALYIDSMWYSKALPLSDGQLVLFSMRDGQNILAKKRHGKSQPDFYSGLLTAQGGEGRFSTDGKLLYDPNEQRVLLLYNYRNTYLVLDTALNLLHTGKTVDTISHVQLKVGEFEKSRSYVLQESLLVNVQATVHKEFLFVRSNILSANEEPRKFRSNVTIDAYHYPSNRYTYSFYLPNLNGDKVRDFRIFDNGRLVGLQGRKLIMYQLPPIEGNMEIQTR